MAVTTYMSTDASAPSITGQNGSLITLLDAVLVNGYGSKPAAGWTKAFSGTNKAVYRMGSGVLGYVRFQDDGPGVGGARDARWRGYEAMSDVDTGTGPFPTTTQQADGMVCRKSDSADSTARPWIVVADDRTFILFVQPLSTTLGNNSTYSIYFGEFYSFVTSDSYRMWAMGRVAEGGAGASVNNTEAITRGNSPISAASSYAEFLARNWTGDGAFGATRSAHWAFCGATGTPSSKLGDGIVPYPNPADGGLYTGPYWLGEYTGGGAHVRGKPRGLWNPLHPYDSFNTGQLLEGTGNCEGKVFMAVRNVFGQTNFPTVVFVEVSDTWLSN